MLVLLNRLMGRLEGRPQQRNELRGEMNVNHTVSIEAIKARQQALLNGEAASGEFEDMDDQFRNFLNSTDDQLLQSNNSNPENVIPELQNPEPETATSSEVQKPLVSENVINLLQNTEQEFPETANAERE